MCAGKPHPNHHLKGEGDNENIILIEDCAHSLGAKYNNKLVGTFGDISMFSFGRDKVISSVNGGMLCVNNDSVMLKHTIINGGTIKFPPYYVIAQNLLYPILASISLKWYNKGKVGKGIMYAAKKLRLIPSILSEKEKNGCYHPTDKLSKIGILHPLKRAQNDALSMRVAVKKDFFYKMPNVLAYLFLQQFKKLEEYNKHRFEIAEFYNEKLKGTELKFPKVWDKSEPVYLRYTLFAENAEEIIKKACKKNIYLGDWYRNVIAPKGVNLAGVFYEQNTCSKAEKYALQSVNLPNHSGISLEDAGRAAVEIRELDN